MKDGTVETRREFLRQTGTGVSAFLLATSLQRGQAAEVQAGATARQDTAEDGMGYLSVYNVRDFGAEPLPGKDNMPPIQAAINHATSRGGGIVFIPPGEYMLLGGLVLPRESTRNGSPRKAPIWLVGSGPDRTMLSARYEGRDPVLSFEPVFGWSWTTNGPEHTDGNCSTASSGYGLQGLGVGRTTPGPVFVFTASGFHVRSYGPRLVNFTMRDAYFEGPRWSAGHQAATISLEGAYNVLLENVRAGGGEVALYMSACSRVILDNFLMPDNHRSRTGIRCETVGNLAMRLIRIEAVNGGFGMFLRNCQNVCGDTISFECRETHTQIAIESTAANNDLSHKTSHVVLENVGLASPHPDHPNGGQFGITIGGACDNIHIRHGSYGNRLRSKTIRIGGQARNVRIEDFVTFFSDSPTSDVEIDPAAQDVCVRILRHARSGALLAGYERHTKTSGLVGKVEVSADGTLSCRDRDIIRVGGTGPLSRLIDGFEGQTVTLLFGASMQVALAAPTHWLSTGAWRAQPNDTLQLVYDGSCWYETSRSVNDGKD